MFSVNVQSILIRDAKNLNWNVQTGKKTWTHTGKPHFLLGFLFVFWGFFKVENIPNWNKHIDKPVEKEACQGLMPSFINTSHYTPVYQSEELFSHLT